MNLLKLHQMIPALAHSSNGNESKESVWKSSPQVKVMTRFKMTENVKSQSRMQAIQGSLTAKQGSRVSSMIRIQIEETKRKVRVNSPEALQFIGPGD